jgi:hypothetical protein
MGVGALPFSLHIAFMHVYLVRHMHATAPSASENTIPTPYRRMTENKSHFVFFL